MEEVNRLIKFISSLDGTGDKNVVRQKVCQQFNLVKDRTIFYCDSFAIRFSKSSNEGKSFSNTVLALSALQKYDNIPFIVCRVTRKINHLYVANTTFLSKISHSSQELTVDNIKGSFNGSDIMKEYQQIPNERDNIIELYPFHKKNNFQKNLERLVEATDTISPIGEKLALNTEEKEAILSSVKRAQSFIRSSNYGALKRELDDRVKKYAKEIMIVSRTFENVTRGRLIEYLIVGDDNELKAEIVGKINSEDYSSLPKIPTQNSLGDYQRIFGDYNVEIDIKTKILTLKSNPKAYNIDKFFEFLKQDDRSVFLIFFVGIDNVGAISTCLTSVFHNELIKNYSKGHWGGRNSRGATQFKGKVIEQLLGKEHQAIDVEKAKAFLMKLIKN